MCQVAFQQKPEISRATAPDLLVASFFARAINGYFGRLESSKQKPPSLRPFLAWHHGQLAEGLGVARDIASPVFFPSQGRRLLPTARLSSLALVGTQKAKKTHAHLNLNLHTTPNWWFGGWRRSGFPFTVYKSPGIKFPNHQSKPPIKGYLMRVCVRVCHGQNSLCGVQFIIKSILNSISMLQHTADHW